MGPLVAGDVFHERLGHSTEMHPDLHAMMQEPIRVAPPKAPDPPPAAPPLITPVDTPSALDSLSSFNLKPAAPAPQDRAASGFADFDLSLTATEPPSTADQPADIFTAALMAGTPAEKASESAAPPAIAFEPGTIAFEAPAFAPSSSADASEVGPGATLDGPDPHVAATLLRLEQFLGAIQSARHA